jgi:hypothetical protein
MESQIGAIQLQTEMSERPWLINHVLVTGPLITKVANNERPSIEITLRVENLATRRPFKLGLQGSCFRTTVIKMLKGDAKICGRVIVVPEEERNSLSQYFNLMSSRPHHIRLELNFHPTI